MLPPIPLLVFRSGEIEPLSPKERRRERKVAGGLFSEFLCSELLIRLSEVSVGVGLSFRGTRLQQSVRGPPAKSSNLIWIRVFFGWMT